MAPRTCACGSSSLRKLRQQRRRLRGRTSGGPLRRGTLTAVIIATFVIAAMAGADFSPADGAATTGNEGPRVAIVGEQVLETGSIRRAGSCSGPRFVDAAFGRRRGSGSRSSPQGRPFHAREGNAGRQHLCGGSRRTVRPRTAAGTYRSGSIRVLSNGQLIREVDPTSSRTLIELKPGHYVVRAACGVAEAIVRPDKTTIVTVNCSRE